MVGSKLGGFKILKVASYNNHIVNPQIKIILVRAPIISDLEYLFYINML